MRGQFFLGIVMITLLNGESIKPELPTPPTAKRTEHMEIRHGEPIQDPYFWLRNKENPDVKAYLEAENAYTETMTRDIKPLQEAIYRESLSRMKQTDLSVPNRIRRYYYYQRTIEGQQYPVRCRKAVGPDGSWNESAREEVLLDQNELARGKAFLAIQVFRISDDDRKLLFSMDVTGFRQYQLFVKDLDTGQVHGPLADRVTTAEWSQLSETVFYVSEDPITKRANQLWFLKLGQAPRRVYEEGDPQFDVEISRSKDLKYLFRLSRSTDTWETSILDASQPDKPFRVILPREKGHKYTVDHRQGQLFLRTNRGAQNFRIVTAPLEDPSPSRWKPFLEHRPGILVEGMELFQDFAVIQEQAEGLNRFRCFDFKAKAWRNLNFPEPAYSAYASQTPDFQSNKFRYTYESFLTPGSVFDWDLSTGLSMLLKREEVLGAFDPGAYRMEKIWCKARDGFKIPISIVYPKKFKKNGKAPLWLYAYGSYGSGMSATFSHALPSLLDRGVAFAIAHIRGGNEMGEAWHEDGMLLKKMNTFLDFIDCAEYLIHEHWTSKDGLLVEGASAGGLLMGAVVNLRPDLFKAVHAAVPFVDVMNTMWDESLPLTTGEFLEWGNPKDKIYYNYMKSYCPYTNLKKRAYPAMLVTTSFNDSQVMYWEPAKYVAKLRTLKTDAHPLLFKCKMEPAGHGGASGRYDQLKDLSFEYAWMLSQVGIRR